MSGFKHFLDVTNRVIFLTRSGFAYGGVFRAKLESLHTQTVEAAMCVDAALCARIGGCALIYVGARLPIAFQTETSLASTL